MERKRDYNTVFPERAWSDSQLEVFGDGVFLYQGRRGQVSPSSMGYLNCIIFHKYKDFQTSGKLIN